jgi:hypothetical protein
VGVVLLVVDQAATFDHLTVQPKKVQGCVVAVGSGRVEVIAAWNAKKTEGVGAA